jgi:hypothetical protein
MRAGFLLRGVLLQFFLRLRDGLLRFSQGEVEDLAQNLDRFDLIKPTVSGREINFLRVRRDPSSRHTC